MPFKLAIICGMYDIKTKTPMKAPIEPTIVLILCFGYVKNSVRVNLKEIMTLIINQKFIKIAILY